MADLTDLQSAETVKIAGANPSTGVEDNFVDADSSGNLFTRTILTNTARTNDVAVTQIGGVNRLAVDVTYINSTDLNSTFTTTGNSSAIDTYGLSSISSTLNVTAVSGSTPTLLLDMQESDDNSNWAGVATFPQITATGVNRLFAHKLSCRYYRWSYTIAGSSPSFTFSISSTLKPFDGSLTSMKRYSDMQLSTGAVSSTFDSKEFSNVVVQAIRSDALANANVVVDGSLDNINWDALTANIALNKNTSFIQPLNGSTGGARYFRLRSTSNVAGTAIVDILWRALA